MTVESYNQDVQPINTVPLNQMLRLQTSGKKVSVAMTDFSVHSHFKHINVTPPTPNGFGYSSSRLRILDTLIDTIMQEKKIREQKIDVSGMDSKAIDLLTEQYARQYRAENRLENLSGQNGLNFGVKDSNTALFLDFKV